MVRIGVTLSRCVGGTHPADAAGQGKYFLTKFYQVVIIDTNV